MRKLFLLLLPIILFSCTAEEELSNQIVGNWRYEGITEFTQGGEAIKMPADECTRKTTLSFSNNGNVGIVDYGVINAGCVIIGKIDSLRWEEVSEGKYRIFSESGATETKYEVSFPYKNTMWMIAGGSYERDGVEYENRAYVYEKI